jgi:hypothetical protein
MKGRSRNSDAVGNPKHHGWWGLTAVGMRAAERAGHIQAPDDLREKVAAVVVAAVVSDRRLPFGLRSASSREIGLTKPASSVPPAPTESNRRVPLPRPPPPRSPSPTTTRSDRSTSSPRLTCALTLARSHTLIAGLERRLLVLRHCPRRSGRGTARADARTCRCRSSVRRSSGSGSHTGRPGRSRADGHPC